MKCHPVANRYRSILIASLVTGGSLLHILPALADQNSPTPGTIIENQATASFTDAADGQVTGIKSDVVKVTVAEVAGISATAQTPVADSGSAYRSTIVYFDFIVKNEGNDPTKFFIPGAPSVATIGGTALPAASIGQLQVIAYNAAPPGSPGETAITTNNLVPAAGIATGGVGGLTGVPNDGSIAAGGYIKVRVPITIPAGANINDVMSVTLGNTANQPANTNTPYIASGNDLLTQDNPDGTAGETSGPPLNGDTSGRRQEASALQTLTVVAPPDVTIKGTVIADANGSGTSTFTNINPTGTETGANVSPAINAILVDSVTGKVIATIPVNPDGTYTITAPGVQPNPVFVILSTDTGTVGIAAPTPSVPADWTNITPLTYSALPFTLDVTPIAGKDFGIEQLPTTLPVSAANQPNPPGTTKYTVPTLSGTDGEDGPLGGGKTFKIVTIPDPLTQGTLYYDSGTGPVAVTAGQVIPNYDPTKLTFDPIEGNVSMSFNYVAIDAAGRESTAPATATMTFSATPIGISGTVYHDKDSSATPTFTNIPTNGEVGTDAVFGTTQIPVKAILVDTNTGLVIGTTVVATDGAYSFTNVPANTDVKVILSPTAGTLGSAPPTAAAPVGWVATSPQDTGLFNTGLFPIVKDFGIRQKAKFVLVKRITKINGATTNPNDGNILTEVTTDTHNNVGNWPTNYLVGKTDAGKVKPNDTIEYTVYFLNNQGADATNVKICDPIRGEQTYVANTVELKLGTAAATSLSDGTSTYGANAAPGDCNAGAVSDTVPGVAIPIAGSVPGATGIGAPTTSFGLFRFTTRVKP